MTPPDPTPTMAARRNPMTRVCRHYNGIQNDACKVGVSFDTLPRTRTGGPSLPCVRADGKTWCEKFEPFAAEEVEADDRSANEEIPQMLEAFRRIDIARRDAATLSGTVICPKCSGVLRFSVARSNGHAMAKCETPNCLAFIQ